MNTKKSPQQWFKYNWDLYLSNKQIYQQAKQNFKIKDSVLDMGEDFIFYDTEKGKYKINEFSSTDEENLKDIEYKAYYHYFVAKQNRKRAMEFHHKIKENALMKADCIGEKDTEGDYLEECDFMKREYDAREHYNEKMDDIGWWSYRELGQKLHKIYV
jgi:hypothetical protein